MDEMASRRGDDPVPAPSSPTAVRPGSGAPAPRPRGPLSRSVLDALLGGGAVAPIDEYLEGVDDPLSDEDLQLALWALYELHYRGLDGVEPDREWDPELLMVRRRLEVVFEAALRAATEGAVDEARASAGDVVGQIRHLIDHDNSPGVASFVHRRADVEQFRELMVQRSLYTLKESDPSSFVLPRLDGPVKVALAELQYDEYGGGRPDRLHATLFARAMEHCGLDSRYGHYVDRAHGTTLAVNNAMSLFGLHRRLRGAALGHLATFEATSTLPCRRIAAGIRRLELDDAVWAYFDEHVEADAVHEEVALRSICARAVADEPGLHPDVLFGAASCLLLDGAAGGELLASWDSAEDEVDQERVPA